MSLLSGRITQLGDGSYATGLPKALLEWEVTQNTIEDPDQFTWIGIKGIKWSGNGYSSFMNLPLNHQNIVQLRFDVDGNKNVLGVYVRGWHNVNGWQDWKTIAQF